jgi:hypothetical protein
MPQAVESESGASDGKILDAANSLIDWWNSQQERLGLRAPVDAPLYHYTSAAGLRGIIEGGQLWFTSIFHLNDPSEFTHGLTLALDELGAVARSAQGKVAPIIRHFCQVTAVTLRKPLPHGFYVASFSSDADELSQWRAYGDDGKGFAIGFGPEIFKPSEDGVEKATVKPIEAMVVGKVIYETHVAAAGHKAAIQQTVKIIEESIANKVVTSEEETTELLKALSVALSIPFIWGAATTKNAAYKAEQETRMLIINTAKLLAPFVDTRVRGSDLVPYIPYQLGFGETRGINNIVIGPSADVRTSDAVGSLLARRGISDKVDVRRSFIPYRSVR